jgi:hypothetical protein
MWDNRINHFNDMMISHDTTISLPFVLLADESNDDMMNLTCIGVVDSASTPSVDGSEELSTCPGFSIFWRARSKESKQLVSVLDCGHNIRILDLPK